MSLETQIFSPKQVADSLQVSESSIKRWCDRGLIPTVRTAGGHRRIPLDGLLEFLRRTSRDLVNPAILGLEGRGKSGVVADPHEPNDPSAQFARLLAAGQETECRRLLTRHYLAHRSVARTAEELITQTMHAFGEAWDCNELAIYQERRGCDICLRMIYELRQLISDPERHDPIAIGAAPAGDPYQLPTSLIELVLRESGWNATSLGNNLPWETMQQAVADYRPKLFWLSVSTPLDAETFLGGYQKFVEQLPSDVLVIVGGRGLTDQLRPRMRYTAHCDNLHQLAQLASAMRRRNLEIRTSDN
jgi:excisionase family DNA binding protein